MIYAPIAIWNFTIYGDPTALSAGMNAFEANWPSLTSAIYESIYQTLATFWATAYTDAGPLRFYGTAISFVVLALVLLGTARIVSKQNDLSPSCKRFCLAFSLPLLINVAVLIYWGIKYQGAFARHLFVLLIPIAISLGLVVNAALPDTRGKSFAPPAAAIAYAVAYVWFIHLVV
jgi:hypothetical protein